MPGNLTQLPTSQAPVRRWLFVYHLSDVPGSEGPLKVAKNGAFDAYAADVEVPGDLDPSNLPGGLYLGHPAVYNCW